MKREPVSDALAFETLYPSTNARAKADAMFDRLPLTTPIGDAIRRWELAYLEAGGRVVPPPGMRT